jgi:8-oxo-dGTP diphosphatase
VIAERPAGKHMAGWWEVPGGKVGRGPRLTLRRWSASCAKNSASMRNRNAEIMTLTHDYPTGSVDLVLFRAYGYCAANRGGLDGQQLKWVDCGALASERLLEADRPFIAALQLVSSSATS